MNYIGFYEWIMLGAMNELYWLLWMNYIGFYEWIMLGAIDVWIIQFIISLRS